MLSAVRAKYLLVLRPSLLRIKAVGCQENQGQGDTPPEWPGPVRPDDGQIAGDRETERGRGAGGVVGRWDCLSGRGGETGRRGAFDAVPRQGRTRKRVRAARLGQGSPRARSRRRDSAYPRTASTPTNAPAPANRAWATTVSASNAPRMWRGQRDGQGRAQGRTRHRGRLGRQGHADRRSRHG